jgi:hypothetical protein
VNRPWETPKNVAILCVALAAIMTGLVALATYVGIRIGQATPPQQINVTGSLQVLPAKP